MKMYHVVVFGYEEFSKEIVRQVRDADLSVEVYALEETAVEEAKREGVRAKVFDLGDDWDEFKHFNMEETLFICALEDDASNVFLTIGLRDGLDDAVWMTPVLSHWLRHWNTPPNFVWPGRTR